MKYEMPLLTHFLETIYDNLITLMISKFQAIYYKKNGLFLFT